MESISVDEYLKLGTKDLKYEWSILDPLFQNFKYEEVVSYLERGFVLTYRVKYRFLESGDIKWLEYISKYGLKINNYVLNQVIKNGNMETLEWIVSKIKSEEIPGINLSSEQFFRWGIEFGNLSLTQKYAPDYDFKSFQLFYNRAFRRGHVEIIKWLNEKYPELTIENGSINIALQRKNFSVIYWLMEKDPDRIKISDLINGNYLPVLEWMYENKIKWEIDDLIEISARTNKSEILNWLLDLEIRR